MIPVLDFERFTSGTDREGFVADLGAARVRFRDVIVGEGGDRALNRAVVSLLGVPVGTVEVLFERR
mgnify:CR=1 FL=1